MCSPTPQTLYSVKAEIQPAVGEQQCRAGTLCRLEVSVTRLIEPSDPEGEDEELTENEGLRTTKLMYEGKTWTCTRNQEKPVIETFGGYFNGVSVASVFQWWITAVTGLCVGRVQG